MDKKEKLGLLKSLSLLDQIPEANLATLGEFLKDSSLADGAIVFKEGSKGESLFFISSGHIRISKRVSEGVTKDLAIVGPGDCFGEMALVEDVARSATATTLGPTVLFELNRKDLKAWLKSHPELAMEFFAEMVQVQSRRLRRTSNELTLLFDLSNILLEAYPSGKELLARALEHVTPHLEGNWASAAYLFNPFNEEMDFAASTAGFDSAKLKGLPSPEQSRSQWLDAQTYYVSLPGAQRALGHLVFRCETPLSSDGKNEIGRTLTTVARLVTSALDNINFRTDEALRERLKKTQAYGQL